MNRTYVRRGASTLAAATSLGMVLVGVPLSPATAQDTQPPAILDNAVTPPPAWARAAAASVAVAGVKGSRVAKQGDDLKVTLAKPRTGVYTRAAGTSTHHRSKALVKRWRNKVGSGAKGVLAGSTAGGQQVSVPVVFGQPKVGAKGRIVVMATPRAGTVPAVVKKYLKIDGVAAGSASGSFTSLSAVAQKSSSKMWHFGSAAGAAKVTKSGAGYSVVIAPGASGAGVQPNGQAAQSAWADLVKAKAKLAKGAKARLIVTGRGSRGKSVAEVLKPTDYQFADGTLTITAKAGSRLTPADRKSIRSMKDAAVSLFVSNPGNTRSYVVITGDSISSGESGRYANGYNGQPFNDLQYAGDGQRGLCALVDLACIAVTTEEVDGVTKWKYDYDLSRVYEKGTEPPTDGGNGCNRSLYAPGTWLTNYFAEEKGVDIGTINLACSGAKTENVKFAKNGGKAFKGEGPQADRLKQLTTWLQVPYVTNTMGANDIRFADIAMACFLAPAEALGFDITVPTRGEPKPNARDFDPADLVNLVPGVVEGDWNPEYRKDAECNQKFGGFIAPARGLLAENYRAAMTDLLAAAPESQIVAMNYPNLISDSEQSDLNRKGAFDLLSTPGFQVTVGVLGSAYDPPLPVEEVMALIDDGTVTPEAIHDAIVGIVVHQVLLSADSLLGTANLLFSADADWAANTVIPAIDDTIYETAGKLGSRVTRVDQRELFNGRQMASRYATTDKDAAAEVVAASGGAVNWLRYSLINDDRPTAPAQTVRTSFVTPPFPGLPMPVACPDQTDISLNGAGYGQEGAQCIGNIQEALHPNLRGQAAQGQCLVAVVTGMLGEGDACVRSIGSNEFLTEPTVDRRLPNWVAVADEDTLCVNAAPKTDYDDPVPSKCAGKMLADPIWSQQQWGKIYRTNVTIPETTRTVQRQTR